MTKLLANENIPSATVELLRAAGFDTASIGQDNSSISDEEVLRIAVRENRLIVTFDRDYGELIFKRGFCPPAGVIYLRMKDFTPEEPAELILKLLDNSDLAFAGLFTVADKNSVRQRKY